MLEGQIPHRQPEDDAGQVSELSSGMVGIAVVVRPASRNRIDVGKHVKLWRGGVAGRLLQAFHYRPLSLNRDGEPRPACAVLVTHSLYFVPKKAHFLADMGDER